MKRKKKSQRIIYDNQYMIVNIFLIFLLIMIFVNMPKGRLELINPNKAMFTVSGTGSMYPMLNKDNRILGYGIELNHTKQLDCGATYAISDEKYNKTVTHRYVYYYNETHAIFKGDNNQYPDFPVEISKVKYKIVAVYLDESMI